MEKRALIAVVLSIAVIYFFQAYLTPPQRPQQPQTPTEQLDMYSAEETSDSVEEDTGVFGGTDSAHSASVARGEETAGKDVTVETDLYTAVMTTHGGLLKSFVLKKYLDKLGENGQPVEMVTGAARTELPLALTLIGKKSIRTDGLLFEVDRERIDLTGSAAPGRITFRGTTEQGVKIAKSLTFFPDNYLLRLDITLEEPDSVMPYRGAVVSWIRVLDPEKDQSSRLGFIGPAAFAEGKLHEIKLKDLEHEPRAFSQQLSWAGYEEKYFMTAFLTSPEASPLIARVTRPEEKTVVVSVYNKRPQTETGGSVSFAYDLFCGPKDIEILKSLGSNLARAIDFGMFDVIAKPLLHALKYLNSVTHNYGVAIIIITVFLKIITFPLTHKSYKSMKSLKDLQPKIEALKKKYKDDRERLNVETINLYRSHKVNPLGGCLPMLIQFPVFIAFYWVLLGSIELRHSPFVFWIKDLSAHDPYFITPLLMGGSMFITQKMTPTSADPTQAKLMLAMPVVFTVLFLKFPAGLVIYWLVNNILQIFQQLYIDKRVS